MLRDIKKFFDHEAEENSYKSATVNNFWSKNYIEHESKGETNKTLSVEEYLNKIRPYLGDINLTCGKLNNKKKIKNLTRGKFN